MEAPSRSSVGKAHSKPIGDQFTNRTVSWTLIVTVHADILQHHVVSAHEPARHMRQVARIFFNRHETRFENRHGVPSRRWPLTAGPIETEETDRDQDTQRAESHEEWKSCTNGALGPILLHDQKETPHKQTRNPIYCSPTTHSPKTLALEGSVKASLTRPAKVGRKWNTP